MSFCGGGDTAEIDIAGKELFGNIVFFDHLLKRTDVNAVLLNPGTERRNQLFPFLKQMGKIHVARHKAVDKLIRCDVFIHLNHIVEVMLDKHRRVERSDAGAGDQIIIIFTDLPQCFDTAGLIDTAGSAAGQYKCFFLFHGNTSLCIMIVIFPFKATDSAPYTSILFRILSGISVLICMHEEPRCILSMHKRLSSAKEDRTIA